MLKRAFKAAQKALMPGAKTRALTQALIREISVHPAFSDSPRSDKKMLDLIAAGADVHATDNNGWTVLMRASFFGAEAIIPTLLERGCAVGAGSAALDRNPAGQTALLLAAMKGHTGIMDKLIAAGADPKAADANGSTALHFAWHPEVAEKLLRAGAAVDATDIWGRTPLLRITMGEMRESMHVLLEWGADIYARDEDGHDALYYAQNNGWKNSAPFTALLERFHGDRQAEKLPVVQEGFAVGKPLKLAMKKPAAEFTRK